MPRGKPFVCWLGKYNDTPLYIGDEVDYELPDGTYIRGKFGHSKKQGYVVRVGRKVFKIWLRTALKAVTDG